MSTSSTLSASVVVCQEKNGHKVMHTCGRELLRWFYPLPHPKHLEKIFGKILLSSVSFDNRRETLRLFLELFEFRSVCEGKIAF